MTRAFKIKAAAGALLGLLLAGPAQAAGDGLQIERQKDWSFAGPLGKFNRAQLQRGFQVYQEVCAACHSMRLVSFRNLAQPGGPEFTPAQAKAIYQELAKSFPETSLAEFANLRIEELPAK